MPNLLALDASSSACSAALLIQRGGGEPRLVSRFALTPREHTRRLLPMVDEVLAEAGLTVAELDAVSYGRGPGSFTGLRIAAGTAQGLAYGLDLPLLGVSTLEALALAAHRRHGVANVVTAMDARMGEIYVAAWRCRDGATEPLLAEAVMPPEQLQLPPADGREGWYAIGSGWSLWEAMPAEVQAAISRRDAEAEPAAEEMVLLAARDYAQGARPAAHETQPIYLRDQVAWQKGK
ncbi:tRNA (adenosine(37)-N6)-threonylcarbamoyltransferase complex dimerization subunit type 1 TsaB [Halomonas sp. MCCC 1A17488]|uniref:tRNA threonylcarbamoyladenosine biosynthesis protein TsaB n=1 Tax=Billgrantia sulfidoxydans TaxID=2733484 RepID=A0ABX7W4V1_9GAMM|nr:MULTISPECIES: tRNA (adenosine(37)-N6)-threonylcarbamoyltransferase complex dimerization subunit type 1 TsaB [Halomonas]MCE8016411.1 tRNA (adenosine(37)-N6)-threonylcarbamoyltransferase complex dimerization subunit type 1 TsaB [Halomonas sp. MCCC 1A17488]MCG3239744.1 tRNA (adenosine(37)-N6)-threonylcarbamoyltransferase complex dimerization subunit type 1 TsaB [Halomonas sp. MCCC 1A17488]QPP50351.1 tRNA (adenosine(37)-N6)-threonylcarbamoyltransferase complex dimerization subunit type 1 TsaB [Ha